MMISFNLIWFEWKLNEILIQGFSVKSCDDWFFLVLFLIVCEIQLFWIDIFKMTLQIYFDEKEVFTGLIIEILVECIIDLWWIFWLAYTIWWKFIKIICSFNFSIFLNKVLSTRIYTFLSVMESDIYWYAQYTLHINNYHIFEIY